MSKNIDLTQNKSVTVQLRDGQVQAFKSVQEVSRDDAGMVTIRGSFFTYVVCGSRVTRITTTEEIVNTRNAYQPEDFSEFPVIPDEILIDARDYWRSGNIGEAISLVVQHTGANEIWVSKFLNHTWGEPGQLKREGGGG
jgi:hypothetical protein